MWIVTRSGAVMVEIKAIEIRIAEPSYLGKFKINEISHSKPIVLGEFDSYGEAKKIFEKIRKLIDDGEKGVYSIG